MAIVKIDARSKRWLITPGDIMERSALLKLPARKWMTQMNMVIAPMIPGNARELQHQIREGQLGSGFGPEAVASIEAILQPTRHDRQFPTWYKFNNTKFSPADHQMDALKRLHPVDAGALLMEMGCFSGDTEYLSPTGWRTLDEYDGGRVAQYCPGNSVDNGRLEFVQPDEYIKKPCDDWYEMKHARGLDLLVDGKHRVAYWEPEIERLRVTNAPTIQASGIKSWELPCVFGAPSRRGLELSEAQLRLQVAVLADGSFHPSVPDSKNVRVTVKKERKKTRMVQLLAAAGIEYTTHVPAPGFVSYKFYAPWRSKTYIDFWEASENQLAVIYDEVFKWDGHEYASGRRAYYSNNKEDVDFIQYVANTRGDRARICYNRGNWHCEVPATQGPLHVRGVNVRRSGHTGMKYSFSVPSTYLVVRRNDRVVVSGNTMKTRVMIDLASAHFFERRIQFVIVIVPLTVKMTTWVDELANFSPCPYNFIDVDSDFQAENFRVQQDRLNWLVVGVESLSAGQTYRRLEPVTRMGVPYAVIVDESTRISNHEAICTQASFNLRRNARIKMIATGFEVKKNIEDLYSQFEFLDPNIIGVGDYVAFRNRYCMMGGYKNKEIIGYNNIDELMGLIAPHVYQCTKEILHLPPKLYERREIIMSPEQKKAYAAMKRGEIEGASVKSVLTKMLRLQQIAAGYYNLDKQELVDPVTRKTIKIPVEFVEVVKPTSNPKLRELLNVAREIRRPMLVWVQSMYEYRIVTQALGKLGRVLSIIGDTPKGDRNAIVKEFQTGAVPFFVGTEAAGGIGTTLTAAGTVAYFSNSQRLENRVQSEDRAHRRGQTGSVTVIDLVAKDTVDVTTLANHAEKIDLAMYVKAALRKRISLDSIYDGELDLGILHELAQERDAVLATEGLSEEEITARRIARAYGIPA